ncbi:hypothetical protein [Legionella sp. WA2024007413]
MSEYQKGDLGTERSHFFPKAMHHTAESETVLIRVQALLSRIEEGIAYCKQQKELYPRMQQYADKISVLNAIKNYICGNIGLDLLEEYMMMYPKWDKNPEGVDINKLLQEALTFKGEPQ